jgi:glyoxylase-like metal-dependent hydrolase (beta-lactamase superfamily II)
MTQIKYFNNNPFQENTYILYDESGDCAIIDPGMYTAGEQNAVINFIKQNQLKPVLLLNTHCHIDHVLGNKLVFDLYGLKPQFHIAESELLEAVVAYAPAMDINYEVSPVPDVYLPETGSITFGNCTLNLLFTPGHSPGHLCFYNQAEGFVIGGDVLFRGSIGRTDLQGGSFERLIESIETQLFTLPDDCKVYPGHGPDTTIGYEKATNPFFN